MSSTIKLSAPATKEFWELPVLFEDEHVLAIEKPSGLLTSPDRSDPDRPNLMRLLHDGIAEGKPWAAQRGLTYLSNAHRLDFETSGIIILAKNKPALVKLANLFGSEVPEKTYLAMVNGIPPEERFSVDVPIGPDLVHLGRVRVDIKGGKKSRTDFEVLERFRGFTLLKCHPFTGRTHQIRIHLRWVQLPIVADAAYRGAHLFLSELKPRYQLKKGREERPLIPRLALHAHQLQLPHPITGEKIQIVSPMPRDFEVALKYLRRYAPAGAIPPSGEDAAQLEDQHGREGI